VTLAPSAPQGRSARLVSPE